MSTAFTEALIRACKRRVSGEEVDFTHVLAEVAAVQPEHVLAEDVRRHFAEAVATMALVQQSVWRGLIVRLLQRVLVSPRAMAEVVAMLAHTRVEQLRQMGLWHDEVKQEDHADAEDTDDDYASLY